MLVGQFIIKSVAEEKKAKKCDVTVIFCGYMGLISNKWNF